MRRTEASWSSTPRAARCCGARRRRRRPRRWQRWPPRRVRSPASPRRDPERLRAAERDVRMEGELLVLDQRQLRPPARELRYGQLGLELAQGRAEAEVDAAPEGEVAAGVVALDVEGVRVG